MTLDQITDYITGKEIDNVGAEASRQIFEKFLVETKGYAKTDILVDVPITVQFKGEDYPSVIDLIVNVEERPFMAVTCVAGSIGSYEREILAGARLVCDHIIPLAISTDARDAVIKDAVHRKKPLPRALMPSPPGTRRPHSCHTPPKPSWTRKK